MRYEDDTMDKNVVLKEIDELLIEGDRILQTQYTESYSGQKYVDESLYYSWRVKVLNFLNLIYSGKNEYKTVFKELETEYYCNAQKCVKTLENINAYIEKGFLDVNPKIEINAEETLERIFSRFHKVARQLRNRHDNRNTLDIEDEYDVQDLLHALLQLYFDDIRAEEWTPSYAGKCARVDFLLKNEKIVIEVKKTRKSLNDKNLGDELIVDIERYKSHSDCEKLICFVYDPEGRIGNPNGVMNDLNISHQGFVKVYIYPDI